MTDSEIREIALKTLEVNPIPVPDNQKELLASLSETWVRDQITAMEKLGYAFLKTKVGVFIQNDKIS